MNKERGKLGAALTIKWLGQCGACARPGRVLTISLSMIAAPLAICITVFHSKLCWTTKKLSLCILYLLCSNVCQTLFHVGLVLSETVCTFHQQTKSTHQAAALWHTVVFIYMCMCANIKTNKSTAHILYTHAFFFFFFFLNMCCFLWQSFKIQTCYHYYTTITHSHKGRTGEDLKLTPSSFASDETFIWPTFKLFF